MSNFRPINRDMDFLMPSSVDEWLPQRHLARFVVEVIEGLDLRAMTGSYRGSGEASYHPQLLLGLIIYGYATGMFSSRNLERATYDSVAFRFIAANEHPDHDTSQACRMPSANRCASGSYSAGATASTMSLLPSGPAKRAARGCSSRRAPSLSVSNGRPGRRRDLRVHKSPKATPRDAQRRGDGRGHQTDRND